MHARVAEAIQQIDAALFSGDTFESRGDDRRELVQYVERWRARLGKRDRMNYLGERVAKEVITIWHLYGGYDVNSRHVGGCLMDILVLVAPALAKRIREGEDPSVIYAERWAEG